MKPSFKNIPYNKFPRQFNIIITKGKVLSNPIPPSLSITAWISFHGEMNIKNAAMEPLC
jgi:hypothetical protein